MEMEDQEVVRAGNYFRNRLSHYNTLIFLICSTSSYGKWHCRMLAPIQDKLYDCMVLA